MRALIAGLDRSLRGRFPRAYYSLIQRPKFFFRFQNEKKLIRGVSLSKSEHPSILFFTTQKCASRYVSRVIQSLAQAEGMVSVDYDAFVTILRVSGTRHPYKPDGALPSAFRSDGYFYGPIGSYRDIPERRNYCVVLQLRDPRDVLTSLYYSTSFSHSIISPKFIKERKEALEMSIDKFVLKNTKKYYSIYSDYDEKLLGQKGVLFLRYEDMVADFPKWLKELAQHTQLDHLSESLDLVKKQANFSFSVDGEDVYAQRRQITPGDYLRKLRPATIEKLNQHLLPVLKTFGYSH